MYNYNIYSHMPYVAMVKLVGLWLSSFFLEGHQCHRDLDYMPMMCGISFMWLDWPQPTDPHSQVKKKGRNTTRKSILALNWTYSRKMMANISNGFSVFFFFIYIVYFRLAIIHYRVVNPHESTTNSNQPQLGLIVASACWRLRWQEGFSLLGEIAQG